MSKWTAEMAQKAVTMYQDDKASVDDIAEALSVSRRAVIGKLVSEKVYVAPVKEKAEPKPKGPLKADYIAAINATGFDASGFERLNIPELARLAKTLGAEMPE